MRLKGHNGTSRDVELASIACICMCIGSYKFLFEYACVRVDLQGITSVFFLVLGVGPKKFKHEIRSTLSCRSFDAGHLADNERG